jgi:pilus assembly protein CpaB
MTSGALRKISIATLVLSALLAAAAFRMSREPEPPIQEEADRPAELSRVVVAAHALEAGAEIAAGDVELREVAEVPPGAFQRAGDVVDQATAAALVAGEPILAEHLAEGGTLRGSLRSGERALAVKTDGVVGLGGYVEPGDRVDVMLYLQQDGREIETSQARVLLRDIRVLAYGARTRRTSPEREPAEARTAVLAVSDDQVPTLMLGAHKGQLRLALRADAGVADPEPDERVATLEDLLGEARPSPSFDRPRVVIYRGTERKEVTP